MAEFATSAAANTLGNLTTEYASPYVSYFFRFGKIVEEFKNQRKELELKKDRVKNDVDEAIRQTEVIEKDVQDWLIRAEKELEETQSLEAEIERRKCFDWCPSWGWRYSLSKKVANKTPCISNLLESCNFQRVGYRAPLQGIEFFPSKDFTPCKSSNSTFSEIIKALNTNGVNMVGLYGMPGVGKTTLAKEVGKQAREQKLFDKVVMVTMSQTPNISKIQHKIAELLGLKFVASTEEGKAEELWRRLKGVKKLLIVIDDVWNEFKLQTIGIPFGVEHEGCKILVTTRLRQVCVQMNCQGKFQLDILSEDEAWALFKDNAGLKDEFSMLNDIAKEVASECKGLPLAIVTVGKALKGASLDGWRAANQRFKNSRHLDNEDVCEDLYNCLKISYDYLKGDNIRSCFLLCSLFPEDSDIDIELLVMFGIGYGIFSNIYLIEDLQMEIREALRKLQESGLLLKTDDGDGGEYEEFDYDDDDEKYVRMHDVVRDFAHWITWREKNIFMVKEQLTEWPVSESFDCCTAISFWNINIDSFPEKVQLPKLKMLVVTQNLVRKSSVFVKRVNFPNGFAQGMKALRVLHLKNVVFSLEVLEFLTHLRTLCFVRCKLEKISSLRNMQNLEILALLDTNVYEVPGELVAFPRLKSLHFSFSKSEMQMSNFPPNLLSRLASLQELHVTCENNLKLSELNSLSRLTALSLRVSTAQCLQENFVFPKLQRYFIAVDEDLRFMPGLTFRTLKIKDFSSSMTAFKELLCNAEKLALDYVMGHKNIVSNVDQQGLNELTSLQLRFCKDMECLMDTTGEKAPTIALSNLVKLNMEGLTRFKELCHGPPPVRFLQKLKDVIIGNCMLLKVVFQMDGFRGEDEINQMPALSNLTTLDLLSLPELECIWKLEPTLQFHVSLHSLKVVKIRNCNKLKSIFSTCLVQSLLHLQQLGIYYCYGLEQVFDFSKEMTVPEENQVSPLSKLTWLELVSLPKLSCLWKRTTHLVNLPSLKAMTIARCFELAYLFPAPLARSLVQLEILEIHNCNSLEHIIIEEAENEVDEIVSNMDDYPICWPKLTTLKIIGCGSLKYVLPVTLAQGLPCLESFEITDCSKLKQVFDITKEKGGHGRQEIVLPRLQVLKLENLENLSRFYPENFVMSLSLKEFKVRSCPPFAQQLLKTLQAHLEDVPLYGFKELFCNAKNLILDRVMYRKNLLPNVDPEGLNELTSLTLKDGKELECLIDTTEQGHVWTGAFFNLVELVVEKMSGLKTLCKGPLPKGFLQNLKKMRVMNCGQLQEVFQTEELLHDMEDNQAPLLLNLTSLELKSLPELQWILKGHSYFVCLQSLKVAEISHCNRLRYLFSPSLAQSLVRLEQLKIADCNGLEHITTELEIGDNIKSEGGDLHPPLLPKLTTLEVSDCPRLKYVFQIPLAEVLPQLKSVSITDSPQLEHVFNVAKVNYGAGHAIVLPCLQHLQLENLINLSCFCSENYPLLSPSLEKLILFACPRLEIFTTQQQVNKQVPLENLRLSKLRHNEGCDRSTSKRIEGIHQLPGPIQVATLQHLRVLNMSNCNGMKSLFSSMLARNLLQLKFLRLECCVELEEIIKMDQTSSQGPLQPISFPSLKRICIQGCSNLKSLFPCSVTLSLSNLMSIIIRGASKLEQVFGYLGELNVEGDQKELVLPKLKEFELLELPNLKSFGPRGYHFRFPRFIHINVGGCPNLITSFSKDSEHFVHAITEAPQQADQRRALPQ